MIPHGSPSVKGFAVRIPPSLYPKIPFLTNSFAQLACYWASSFFIPAVPTPFDKLLLNTSFLEREYNRKQRECENLLLFAAIEDDSDRQFAEELYIQFRPLIRKVAYAVSGDAAMLDDRVQDAFTYLLGKLDTLRPLNHARRACYIAKVTKGVTIDYLRRKRHWEKWSYYTSDDELEAIRDPVPSPEELYLTKEQIALLAAAVSRLSERDQDLLYYRYRMDLKYKVIAKWMNLNPKHIPAYLARARKRAFAELQKELGEEGGR